jgi:hypothetical protein
MSDWFSPKPGTQIPLIHIVDQNDIILRENPDATWFQILEDLEEKQFSEVQNKYYSALYFCRKTKNEKFLENKKKAETRDQAQQRFLFDRPTMGNPNAPIILPSPVPNQNQQIPGYWTSPERIGGRRPKDFFCMLKAFLGIIFMEESSEPCIVHRHLVNNPSFARACGFITLRTKNLYNRNDIPSLRTLEQFDQIMTEQGLWHDLKIAQMRENIQSGVIRMGKEWIHDTTHVRAKSKFEVVNYVSDKGEEESKSASRAVKNCHCQDKKACPHPWVQADPGAGTVVKSKHKTYWAHKSSILMIEEGDIIIDAYEVMDASTHDGNTIVPSLERLFSDFPELSGTIKTLIDDGAADENIIRKKLEEKWGIRLVCSMNSRGRKAIKTDLPRGIDHITPSGVPVCMEGNSMELIEVRRDTRRFIFGCPVSPEGFCVCLECPSKMNCCPRSDSGRNVSLPFNLLSWIDPENPQLSKRYKKILKRRTAIERGIKKIKCDMKAGNMYKRGHEAGQALIDKTLVAYQMLLRFR